MSKNKQKRGEDSASSKSASIQEVEKPVVALGDEPISKVAINKYDPFQLKGSIDDEIVFVSTRYLIV